MHYIKQGNLTGRKPRRRARCRLAHVRLYIFYIYNKSLETFDKCCNGILTVLKAMFWQITHICISNSRVKYSPVASDPTRSHALRAADKVRLICCSASSAAAQGCRSGGSAQDGGPMRRDVLPGRGKSIVDRNDCYAFYIIFMLLLKILKIYQCWVIIDHMHQAS